MVCQHPCSLRTWLAHVGEPAGIHHNYAMCSFFTLAAQAFFTRPPCRGRFCSADSVCNCIGGKGFFAESDVPANRSVSQRQAVQLGQQRVTLCGTPRMRACKIVCAAWITSPVRPSVGRPALPPKQHGSCEPTQAPQPSCCTHSTRGSLRGNPSNGSG